MTRFDVVNFISHGVSKVGADERRQGGRRRRRGAKSTKATKAKTAAERKVARQGAANLRGQPERKGRQGADRPAGRPQERTGTRDPRAAAPAQEQPDVRRRGRRRQDRDRRGAGARDPAGEVPAPLKGVDDLRARHGRGARRHPLPRRLRAAPQGRHQGGGRQSQARSCSSTRSTPSSARARPRAAPWTRRNLLKPALASGELRCIGSTTYQEYKRSFDRDKALARRFQRIDVAEPRARRPVLILDGLKTLLREASQRPLHRRRAGARRSNFGAIPP